MNDDKTVVAIHSCGRIVAVKVIDIGTPEDVSRVCTEWISRGHSLETLTLEEVRAADWCDCFQKKAVA